MPIEIADHFYTLTETAQKLGVNRLTVRRWIKAGRLEAQRVGGVVLIERQLVDARRNSSRGACTVTDRDDGHVVGVTVWAQALSVCEIAGLTRGLRPKVKRPLEEITKSVVSSRASR